MYKSKLYINSPDKVQEIFINIKSLIYKILRENFLFSIRVKQLIDNTKKSRDQIIDVKIKELKKTLELASRYVPAYKSYNSDYGSFPVTFKHDLQLNNLSYINRNTIKFARFVSSTGGTTGKPLTLYSNLKSIIEDHAQSYRQLLWAGFKKGDRRIWLRADLIVPLNQERGSFWRKNHIDNMLMMSAYHINSDTVSSYVNEINKYEPKIIQAYPSAIYLLASLIESCGLRITVKLKSIVLSSESFSKDQKLLIERVFGCKVFSWYGLSERVATVGTCSEGKLHLIEDYGVHEFDENNVLIATGFHNKVMPIIRYNTGDRFNGIDKTFIPCECGLPFLKVGGIEGRVGEYLIASNGSKVSIFNHIPKGVVGLIELQLLQNTLNEIVALVVVDGVFNTSSEEQLILNIKKYLGEVFVTVKYVNSIERTKSGKFRQAICHIKD